MKDSMPRSLIGAFLFILLGLAMHTEASLSPPTLEATLLAGESVSELKTVDIPARPPRADVIFAFDLTGSMSDIIDTAKARAIEIMTTLNGLGVDINYAVVSYMDYPACYDSYGYSSCYGDSWSGDYAYRLDQAVTSDTAAVANAINNLVQGSGADGPQDYTRILYESYADPLVGWRPGAKRILLNFGDNVPHDDNLNEGVTGGSWTTGGDPGRDETMFTADDLDLQTVLAGMVVNNVTLLEAHTADWPAPPGLMVLDYWNYWTGITGGATFLTTSGTLVADVVSEVTAELTSPTVSNLHLEASVGFEGWIESVAPPSYSGPTGVSVEFELTIRVPDGTAGGTYVFTISAVDGGGVSYGDQSVTIHVPSGPRCDGATATPGELWPPNHKYVKVSVVGVTDPDGDPITISITGITQDEALDALGDGHTCPDGAGVGTDTALVRAERGKVRGVRRNGRVYHVSFVASDGRGGECVATVQVCVPPNRGRGHVCVDEGPLFDSTGPCS